jgi:hypothetical protein
MSGPIPNPISDTSESLITNFVGFAGFTVLIWDHIDTFVDEVEYIWKGKKGPLVYLFLLNRYLTPLGFMVNLFAYLSPVWTPEKCQHFIRYEGSMTVIGIEVVGLMMLLRVYAMWYQKKWIVGFIASILVVETGINAWLLTHGQAVVHSPIVHSCTMIFEPSLSKPASSSAWIPLLYDTFVVILTLCRTVPSVRHRTASHIVKVLLEDGLLYYSVIFSINLVLTLMIIFAPPGLKNITAQLELLLTVAMMSRITLNLKKQAAKQAEATQLGSIATDRSMLFRRPGDRSQPYYVSQSKEVSSMGQVDSMGQIYEIGDAKSLAVPADEYGNPWGKPKLDSDPTLRSHLPL